MKTGLGKNGATVENYAFHFEGLKEMGSVTVKHLRTVAVLSKYGLCFASLFMQKCSRLFCLHKYFGINVTVEK